MALVLRRNRKRFVVRDVRDMARTAFQLCDAKPWKVIDTQAEAKHRTVGAFVYAKDAREDARYRNAEDRKEGPKNA